ncbi:hypothetical protein BHE90_001268 [Fusarium euwallaceae]|uniref:ZZ-type domain-containing protein n=1 Tax=Fusarium euwallaceae TaxID=1147111 RepID=A0A430M8A2_9HYPO|nr:hypothetical protein BHE90_001268 [Fusarium euwallaceae]
MAATTEATVLKTGEEEEEQPQGAEVPVNEATEVPDNTVSDEQNPKEAENENEEDDDDEKEKEDYKEYSHPVCDDHRLGLEVVSTDENTSSASYDIVAIHGMHSWSQNAWERNPRGPIYESWLDTRFNNLSEHSGRVMLYGYDPGDRSGKSFTCQGVYEEAEALLNALLEFRTPEIREKRRPIWFLSHDLGGLLVKAAMVLATRHENKYADILHCTRSLAFFGYPHRYETRGFLEEGIARLLSPMQYRPYVGNLWRTTKSLTEIVIEVNDAFLQTRLLTQAHLVNVISTIPPGPVKVFDQRMSTMGIPFELRYSVDQPNHWLTNEPQDTMHVFRDAPNQQWLGPELPGHLYPALYQLLDQSSPIYPHVKLELIEILSELDDLVDPFDNKIIHLRCTHANTSTTAWVSERARLYLQYKRETSQPLLFFKFDEHDIRFNNALAMLQTFNSRLLFHRPREVQEACKNIAASLELGGVTGRIRLFSDFEYLRGQSDFERTIHVLGCFDECDESSLWFLDELCDYLGRNESNFRLLIITTNGTKNDKAVAQALSQFAADTVTSIEYEPPKPLPPKIDQTAALLIQERPQFSWNGHHEKIRDLLFNYEQDGDLYELLVDWLKSAREPFKLETGLFTGPFVPEVVFSAVLAEMPDERRAWAQKLLSWVLTSLRPLQVAEFSWISDDLWFGEEEGTKTRESTDQYGARHHVDNIIKYFGGLLVVMHGEIRFRHPDTREWLLNHGTEDNTAWYRQGSETERNQVILKACLSYLCNGEENATAWAQHLPYAIEFWPHHYRQTASEGDAVKGLFGEPSLFKRWIEAYNALPTPFLKPHPDSRKPLPVAAHFGFGDLVRSQLGESPDFETRGQALVEATRAGQLAVIELIIESFGSGLSFDDEYLHQAVKAASFCEDHDVFQKVAQIIPEPPHAIPVWTAKNRVDQPANEPEDPEPGAEDVETHENPSNGKETGPQGEDKSQDSPHDPFHWLAVPLLQAATMGLDDVITKLISVGANPSPPKGTHLNEKTPLHRAAAYGNISSIKLLLDAGATWATPRTTPLLTAGSPLAATTLLENGATLDARMLEENRMPVQILSQWGDYLLLKTLLEYRDYKEYYKEEPEGNPVTLAARFRNKKCLELLLKHGFNPNIPNPDGETALWWAINNRRTDMCRLLLEHGADPDLTPEKAVPPLIESVFANSLDIMKLLVEHKADINKKEVPGKGWQRTPLHAAIDDGHSDQVEYLLKQGADPNVKDSDDLWAIYTAAENGRTDMVRMLAEAKADLNTLSGEQKWTPIHACTKYPEIVQLLIELGADLTITSLAQSTPLDVAVLRGHRETIDVILSKSKVKFDLSLQPTRKVMVVAVELNYVDVIEAILEAGADVNTLDPMNDNNKNESLLCMAMRLPSEDMVRKLLEFRPDLDVRSEKQNTVLHCITERSPVASFRLVVNAGGRLDVVNNMGLTPLQMAARNENLEVFRYMMTKEAALSMLHNSSSDRSGTVLHDACKVGSLEMVRMLIEKQFDLNFVTDGYFGTPLITATMSYMDDVQKKEMLELLLENGADPSVRAGFFGYPLNSACMCCPAELIKLLLDKNAPIDFQDPFGRKPAHIACYNSLEVLNLLNAPDSDFAVRDELGRVPLHYAVVNGQLDIAEEVLTRSERVGITIDVKDNDGWTPLLWAARASTTLRQLPSTDPMTTDMVSFLLERGADPTIEGLGFSAPSPASQIAYYSGADDIGDLIVSKTNKGPPTSKRRGKREGGYCDCCLLEIVGSHVMCETCSDFWLCFKCSRSRSKFHPRHEFRDQGEEWDDNGNVEGEKVDEVPKTPVKVNGNVLAAIPEEGSQSDEFDDEIVG